MILKIDHCTDKLGSRTLHNPGQVLLGGSWSSYLKVVLVAFIELISECVASLEGQTSSTFQRKLDF